MSNRTLVPLSGTSIRVGEPLPFPIFDTHGRQLLGVGEAPRNERHAERIHEIGMVDAAVAERAGAPPAGTPGDARPQRPPAAADCRLAALRMPSGSLVQISQAGDPPRRLVGTLIGILPREAIYVGLPAADGRAPLAARGAPVGFRSVLGTEIVRFDSTLLHYEMLPFQVAVFAYPTSIAVQRFRRHPRVPTDLQGVITNYASSDIVAVPCRVSNLSVGGLQLECHPLAMKPGDQVGVDLVLPGPMPRNAFKLMGRVRNSATTEDPDLQRCGLEFFELEPQQRLLLENFVLRAMAERPRAAAGG
ncbi:MAG: flagellar brake protein [Pseudomonadota bacterium]